MCCKGQRRPLGQRTKPAAAALHVVHASTVRVVVLQPSAAPAHPQAQRAQGLDSTGPELKAQALALKRLPCAFAIPTCAGPHLRRAATDAGRKCTLGRKCTRYFQIKTTAGGIVFLSTAPPKKQELQPWRRRRRRLNTPPRLRALLRLH